MGVGWKEIIIHILNMCEVVMVHEINRSVMAENKSVCLRQSREVPNETILKDF